MLRRAGATSSKPDPPSGWVPIKDAPKSRRPYGMRYVLTSAEGRVLTPDGMLAQVLPSQKLTQERMTGTKVIYALSDDDEDEDIETENNKKRKQWQKWSEEVIPSLIEPYVKLLWNTDGLRSTDYAPPAGCPGCVNGRHIEVTCIFFERIEKIVLCTCTSVAIQLLSRRLFPCAPLNPSLAVDLNMLDFAKELFVNMAPNTTAWCETLEGFLNSRKFKLKTRPTEQFEKKIWKCDALNYLGAIRNEIFKIPNMEAENFSDDDVEMDSPDNDNSIPENLPQEQSDEVPKAALNRPSDYLRDRCPLCFGGQNWAKPSEVVDSIVCLDACFTQKRRKSESKGWHGPDIHPETVFVPKEEILDMEAFVEELRNQQPKPKPKKRSAAAQDDEPEEEEFEPNMKVPTSVLNECNDSFVAADERRTKASTKFFADTGLMALLCRHDRVLWLANMTSAGEKQHYALCLLAKLFSNIPETMRIGVLYDVGCQLHRSCEKYGFLGEYLKRIVFGISVFHAYGHQWPCQLIYHPRKCEGFGLTDGEGCERFWSSLKSLIPSCRVSGYFTRMYTIDTKVRHLDDKSLLGLGNWIHRKWLSTLAKKEEVTKTLEEVYALGFTKDTLEKEWKLQVIEQSKPLKRQSKYLADKELQEILVLTKAGEDLKKDQELLQEMISTGIYKDNFDVLTAQTALEEATERAKKTQSSILYKKSKLSVDGRLNLKRLIGNEFLRKRMNALALKQRIRDRLRNRKFEMENLERAYRNTVNHSKLEKHASQQIKKKEPGILALARNYNKLCVELKQLIAARKAPRGAIAPIEIVYDGLFKLDVDDDIWQDIGLTEDENGAAIPGWLGNETIRTGIKALLELNRCLEEERRLKEEVISMHQWFREEWAAVIKALEWSKEDPKLVYQLEAKKKHLLRVGYNWRPKIQIVSAPIRAPWGPSEEDWKYIREYEQSESVLYGDDDMIGEKDEDDASDDEIVGGSDEDDDIGIHDAELIDGLENVVI